MVNYNEKILSSEKVITDYILINNDVDHPAFNNKEYQIDYCGHRPTSPIQKRIIEFQGIQKITVNFAELLFLGALAFLILENSITIHLPTNQNKLASSGDDSSF